MDIDWQQLGAVLALLSGVIAVGLMIAGWVLHTSSGSALALLMFAASILVWSLVYLFQSGSDDADGTRLLRNLAHWSAVVSVPFWLLFVLNYTGKRHWISHPSVIVTALIPIAMLIVVCTYDTHALPGIPHVGGVIADWRDRSDYWPLVWGNTGYYFGALALASVLLAQTAQRGKLFQRGQMALFLMGSVLPWIGIIFYWSQITPDLDITPLTFALAGLILVWILLREDYVPGDTLALRETVIHEMDNGLIVMDNQDRVLEANPAAARWLFMKPAQAIGKIPDIVFANCPSVLDLFKRLTALEEADEKQGEAVIGTGKRERFVELSVSQLLNRRGKKAGRLVIFHDITTLKQAQLSAALRLEELAALREIDSRLSSSLDINTVLHTALAFAIRMSGADAGLITLTEGSLQRIVQVAGKYAESERRDTMISLTTGIIGRVVQQMEAELVPDVSADPDYFPAIPDTCAQMAVPLMTYDSVVGVVNLETADPTQFTPEILEFMKLLAGRIAGAIENAQLYTLSLKQVVELKTTYDQVRELEQMKTEMIRVASHDLKNPLNVIVGYLSLLEVDYGQMTANQQLYLTEITRQADRMMSLIQDILTLERLQGAVIYEPTDLQAIVSIAISELATQAADRAQIVEKYIHAAPLIVNGDAAQLREVVTNLIGNAIKYTPDGGHITLRLEPTDGTIVFEVLDDGYGIPEDRQRRLFQPFYRAKVEGTEAIEGTGLGLHLAKSIIQRHGGKIRFHSVYGTGSRFGFELPLST